MRIRTIKPEFWTDKRVASWDMFTRLTFIGLWSAADDCGRGSAEPARIAAELFPYDLSRDPRETLASVSRALATLSESVRITIYRVGDEHFYQVANWERHQRVDKPSKSRIPAMDQGVAIDSRDPRETLASVSRDTRDWNREQGTGNRERGTGDEEQGTGNFDSTLSLTQSPSCILGGVGEPPVAAGPQPHQPRKPKKALLPDGEWLNALETDPAFLDLDVPTEIAKCRIWCETNSKSFSRRRIVNWLTNAKPVKAPNGTHLNHHPKSLRNTLIAGSDLWDKQAAEAIATQPEGF